MRRDRDLERRLRDLEVPDETAAEQRAWEVVRAAYAARTPIRPARRMRRVAVALATAAAVLGLGLTPAGARVVDLVRDVVGVGSNDARPALRSLPAAGELLVTAPRGPWIVRADGSKRLLGEYRDAQATWSPNGLHVAIATGRELVAVDPAGDVRWSLSRARVADPRWSPSGYRIAYRSAGGLRVVAGDGTEDRLLARNVPAVAPDWQPNPDAKLEPALEPGTHVLAYAPSRSRIAVVDTDTGEVLTRIAIPDRDPVESIELSADGSLLLARTGETLFAFESERKRLAWQVGIATSAAAISPDGRRVAAITEPDPPRGESRLMLIDARTGQERRLPAGLGQFSDVAWSPDGRWLLLAWRAADQWLFIRPDRPRRLVAVGDISRQFTPGSPAEAAFPRIAGWVLPDRP